MDLEQKSEEEKNKQQYLSYALILCSCFFWVSGYIYSNEHKLSAIETSMLRGFCILVGCFVVCRYKGEALDFKK